MSSRLSRNRASWVQFTTVTPFPDRNIREKIIKVSPELNPIRFVHRNTEAFCFFSSKVGFVQTSSPETLPHPRRIPSRNPLPLHCKRHFISNPNLTTGTEAELNYLTAGLWHRDPDPNSRKTSQTEVLGKGPIPAASPGLNSGAKMLLRLPASPGGCFGDPSKQLAESGNLSLGFRWFPCTCLRRRSPPGPAAPLGGRQIG